MRKRLRKKRRLGEFQELCFDLAFTLPTTWTDAEHDAFWDAFIGEAIEAHHLVYGGASGAHWNGIVSGSRRTRVGEPHRAAITRWLGRHSVLSDVAVGPLYDAWHHRPVRAGRDAAQHTMVSAVQ